MDSCAVCGATGELKRCARCKVVKYCGREHQVQHWTAHKASCKKQKTRESPSPPCGPSGSGDRHLAESSPGASGGEAGATASVQPENSEPNPAIPFDARPLKLVDFDKPASRDPKDILQLCFDGLSTNGYAVIDDVLEEEECVKLEEEIKRLEESGRMKTGKLEGGKTSGLKDEMVVNESIRSDKMAWLDGVEPDFPQINKLIIDKMDGYVLPLTAMFNGEITLSGRTKAMVACYPGGGTSYHRHVDNPAGDGRIISCLFYVNRDWDSEKMGGALRIFPSSLSGDYVDIAPVMNRMAMFWSDQRTPHEVQSAFANRYAITMWYFDAEQRAKAKEKQMQEELEKIESDIVMLKVKTKAVEKETMEKKIETTATNAINMLAPEELAALAQLVDSSSDPRALLTSLGIAHVLQDKVLQAIAERKQYEAQGEV